MKKNEQWSLELSHYLKQSEPSTAQKAKIWETAIGLQEVDGLKPSKYLVETVKDHIEGKIALNEVEKRVNNYYETLSDRKTVENQSEEADKVSIKITEVLSDNSFNFNPTELISIHKKLFSGIYKHAGIIRNYNFTKKEWVLNNDSVTYSSFENIMPALEYDFNQEKNFSYENLSLDDAIKHLCRFTSDIWQIHPFCEGNTRTTAVFIIKYLRTFGFNINDEVFANNSWYFRNSLVRANYKNFEKNIFENISYLEKFFYNLLSNTKYELKNRFTHIDYMENQESEKINISLEEQIILNIIRENPNINQEEIAQLIGKSIRTVKTRMIEMQEKGLLTRENGKRNGKWIAL